jgi:hypothetical protein
MKFEKHCYDYKKCSLNNSAQCSNDEGDRNSLCIVDNPHNLLYEKRNLASKREDKSHNNVEKEEHKKLTVGKTNAISNPGTVVIHIQDTSLAG